MRRTVLSLALLFASSHAFAGTWTDLWLTPDQQGQRLLDAGDAAKAAQRFQDPRRRAYADVKAGNYESAARQLASLKDVDSLYNRGNALARAGKLKEALAAYDAALAKAPNDPDARHNRDLVARQLQKQKQNTAQQNGQQGKGGQQGQQQNGSQKSGSEQQSAGQDRKQSSQEAGGSQQGDRDRAVAQKNPQQSSSSGDSSARTSKPKAADSGDSESHSASNASSQASQPPQTGRANDSGNRNLAAPAEQTDQQRAAAARRDVQAAQGGAANHPPEGRIARSDETRKPTSEQALARDQWLRQIPDNPGELLRRKFMVEHLKKQQDSSQ
jgi:Ca-activated chloride channel family protein